MIKKRKKFIIKLFLVLIWLGVIFFFSSSDSNDTTNQSLSVTRTIVTYTIKLTNKVNITNIELNENNLNSIIVNIHPIIRKLAHYTEYFVLSILVLLMIKETNMNYYYIFTIIFCLLMAIFDEIHQLFIDGRFGNITDVLIDVFGCLSYLLINKAYRLIKNK